MVTVIRPSRVRRVKETIPRHDRAVLPFKEGRMLVASTLWQTFGLRLRLNQPTARAGRFIRLLIVATPAVRLTERYGIAGRDCRVIPA